MDPKTPARMLLAPSASSGGALRLPARDEPPPVDEHVVRPETREELVRGRRVIAMPALAPHGDQHFRLDYVIGGVLRSEYIGSTDLLTRPAVGSNFATDTCVRRDGTDPQTGRRYLEELAFEVVHEQSLKDVTDRAEDLTNRGVRRVFAIFVKKREVCEWSPKKGAWQPLGEGAAICDACLDVPLAAKALLDVAEARTAVARALVEQNHPVIVEVRQQGRLSFAARQFERRIGRPLTQAEHGALSERLDRLGQDRVDDVRDELSGNALAAWLADPATS